MMNLMSGTIVNSDPGNIFEIMTDGFGNLANANAKKKHVLDKSQPGRSKAREIFFNRHGFVSIEERTSS